MLPAVSAPAQVACPRKVPVNMGDHCSKNHWLPAFSASKYAAGALQGLLYIASLPTLEALLQLWRRQPRWAFQLDVRRCRTEVQNAGAGDTGDLFALSQGGHMPCSMVWAVLAFRPCHSRQLPCTLSSYVCQRFSHFERHGLQDLASESSNSGIDKTSRHLWLGTVRSRH